jgi:hypothetical protein
VTHNLGNEPSALDRLFLHLHELERHPIALSPIVAYLSWSLSFSSKVGGIVQTASGSSLMSFGFALISWQIRAWVQIQPWHQLIVLL